MKNSKTTILSFFKRNAVYLVLALCILAVALSVTFILINRTKMIESELNKEPEINQPVDTPNDPLDPSDPVDKPDGPVDPSEPVVEPLTFCLPVENATTIEYYSETMVFNSTLGRFSSHKAIDFYAEEGSTVFAVADGTVKSVETTMLTGVTITIDHGDGLLSIYNSLADAEGVAVGDVLKKGDTIGEVSTSNRQEYKAGAHLHFEMQKDGELIDPSVYLVFEEK